MKKFETVEMKKRKILFYDFLFDSFYDYFTFSFYYLTFKRYDALVFLKSHNTIK